MHSVAPITAARTQRRSSGLALQAASSARRRATIQRTRTIPTEQRFSLLTRKYSTGRTSTTAPEAGASTVRDSQTQCSEVAGVPEPGAYGTGVRPPAITERTGQHLVQVRIAL